MTLPAGPPLNGWTPPPRPARIPAEGRFVRLDPLDADSHATALHRAFDGHDSLWAYMAYGPFGSATAYHAWVAEQQARDDPLFFALCDPDSGTALGVASYLRITPEAGSVELGHICLSPALQRTAAATEAIFLMMDRAFAAGYRRFEWKCNAANLASRRAAQRLGFSFEGVFRNHMVVKGVNRDTAWFSVIDREWPGLKAAFVEWLSPANFNPAGGQDRRLSDLTRPLRAAADPAL